MEKTLSIIKPDAVKKNFIGNILKRFENANLNIVAIKMVWLSNEEGKQFYKVHCEKPFYNELVDFISSGPIVVSVLEGENAISKNRKLMGATDPKKADKGTIRADLAESITSNAVHGSDAIETAKTEINFFFTEKELFSR